MMPYAYVDLRMDYSDIPPHTFFVVTDPNGNKTGYGLGPAVPLQPTGPGKIYNDQLTHPFNTSSGDVALSQDQYNRLIDFINQPAPYYDVLNQFGGEHCGEWAVDALLAAADLPELPQLPQTNGNPFDGLTNLIAAIIWSPYLEAPVVYAGGQAHDLYVFAKLFGKFTSVVFNSSANLFSTQFTSGEFRISPIILDLNGDGVSTISKDNGVYFDLRNIGFAQATGWVAPTDGLLAWDRNGNGLIDNGGELFGNFTNRANGTVASNGFDALASFDSNSDGKIDSSDTVWNNLKIWVDANSNSITDAGELHTLSSVGVQSLMLSNGGMAGYHDPSGNEFAFGGGYNKTDGSIANMVDVNFATGNAETVAESWVATTSAIDALPDLQGQGTLYSLHQAMARDTTGTLQTLVTQFINATTTAARNTAMESILLNWSGAQNVVSTSRNSNGSTFDAKHLAVLEAALGTHFQNASTPGSDNPNDPYVFMDQHLTSSYFTFFEKMYTELAAQTFLKPFYDEITTVTDSNGTHFDFTAVLADLFGSSRPAAQQQMLVEEFYRTVFASGIPDAQVNYAGLLSSLATHTPQYVTDVNQIVAPYYNFDMVPTYVPGSTIDLGANSDNSTLMGGLGGSIIYANSGPGGGIGNYYNTTVYANAGTNIIIAAPNGADKIFGGTGDDTIRDYGTLAAGTIFDGGAGNNTLSAANLQIDISRATISNIQKLDIGGGTITLTHDQFYEFSTIDTTTGFTGVTINAANGGSWSLRTQNILGTRADLNATDMTDDITLIGNDFNNQTLSGGHGTTVLTAGNGTGDRLIAGSGITTMNAGSGGDTLYEGTNINTLNGGAGVDTFIIGGHAGTVVNGGSEDTVVTYPSINIVDISAVVFNGVHKFEVDGDVKLTLGQFNQITTLTTTYTGNAHTLFATDAGTYSLAGKTISAGNFNLDAEQTSANVTLIGNNQDAQILRAGSGNDTLIAGNGANNVLYGSNGNTVFVTGIGNTLLNGGGGNDTFKFGAVFGQDIVNNTNGGTVNDELDFTSLSTTKQNLWLTQSGSDLVIRLLGTNQTVTVWGWFDGSPTAKLQSIVTADGMKMSATAVSNLANVMATYQSAHATFNPATATAMPTDTTLQSAITAAWVNGVNFSNVTVAYAVANQTALDAHGSYTIADTATNIVANLSFLQSDASHITSIALTDGGTPTLALTAAQYVADATVFGKIGSAYNLSISGVTAASASATAGQAHVTSITIADTAANFLTNVAALQTLATGTKLASITLTDGGIPAITLTAAQMTADAAALGKIISNYNLTLTGGGTITEPAAITAKTITLHSTSTPYTFTANSTSGLTIVDDGVNDDTINITGGSVNLLSNSYADVVGANNTITVGTNGTIGVYGSNNTVTAGSGDDLWIGSSSSTGIVINGTSNESYHFDNTFGQDTINNGTGTVANGNASFYTGVTKANLWFKRSGNDLIVTRIGSTNQITIAGWYTGNGHQVQSFTAGGLFLSGQVNQLVTAMAAYQTAHSTFNPQTASAMPTDTTLQNAINAAWVSGIAPTVSVATAIATQTSLDTTAGGYEIVDTAANIVANMSFLLSDATHIASIQLTDSTTPTITLTSAQQTTDAAVLAKITSPYNLTISGGSTVTASVAATATSTVAVSDTSANVLSFLSQLQTQAVAGRISSITFTDGTTPTLALTAAQLTADTTVLGTIISAYNLSISGVTASNASTVAGTSHVTALTVSDTAANVTTNIAALQTLATGTKLSSITLTDGTTPTLSLTSTQYTADTAALGKIGSAYNLSISGVTAANASTTAGAAHVTSITVSDTAANVVTNIAALQTLAGGTKLSSITLTDGTTPTLALTAAQYSADATALGKIGSAYNLSISGVTAANAATIAAAAHVTSITISDTAANILANITALQTLAAGTILSSITLTDGTTPTLALTAAQDSADAAVLGKITSAYNLTVSGVTAANASSIAGQAHFTTETISDTAANFVANIASLETLASTGKVTAIAFTDSGTPTVTLTAAQQAADADALNKITSAYNLVITGGTVTASVAATATSAVAVSDTSANVMSFLSQLQTQAAAGRITSIAFTDGTTPTLALTATQLTADTTVLSKITSAYNLSISAVTAANASTTAGTAHVTSIMVSDTAANFITNIAALQTLATGTKLSSITLTDGTTPTLSLTATQYSADTAALGKISSAYNLAISAVTAANASTVAGAAHVTSITVSDTGANVVANIAALQTLAAAGKLTSVALTDGGTPTLNLTAAQYSADATALSKIGSAYNLSISGVTAASASATAGAAHVTSITVSDTAANFVTNVAALQTLATGTKLASITLTDGGTPAITLTGTQMTADAAALGKIVSNYNLTLTGGGTFTEPAAITATTVTLHSTTTPYTFTANSTAGLTIVDDGVNDDTINVTGKTVNLLSSAYVDVVGDGNTITTGTNATLGIYGSNDTVTAGSGNDLWIGSSARTGIVINGSGNENYHFDNTFGQDTINNGGGTVANGNISFYTGVTDESLWFKHVGNDLTVQKIGSTNQITIAGWYTATGNQVQSFNAGGLTLDSQVAQLVNAMASYQTAHSSFNAQTASAMPTDTTLQNAITAAWHS